MSLSSVSELLSPAQNGERYKLFSPTAMPKAAGFLWNKKMMLQVTCRGYAVAQHMQPEPSKYAHAPLVEGKTFMLPEQPYYVNHPGRFFILKTKKPEKLFQFPMSPCAVNWTNSNSLWENTIYNGSLKRLRCECGFAARCR